MALTEVVNKSDIIKTNQQEELQNTLISMTNKILKSGTNFPVLIELKFLIDEGLTNDSINEVISLYETGGWTVSLEKDNFLNFE